ncbi:MAG: hypothetical protein IPH63_04530 [Flavobacteriales bacterium]|jgi:hypothetical protein|nr:hypothetical protein [Flavobacteriales bacterium]
MDPLHSHLDPIEMTTHHLSFVLALFAVPCGSQAHCASHLPGTLLAETPEGSAPLEALFNTSVIQDILKDSKCTGIRFYTVDRTSNPNSGSLAAIGIDKDGKEINGWLGAKAYHQYSGLYGNEIGVEDLSGSRVSDGCIRYNAHDSSFAAGFSRTDVEDLLRSGCGALWLTLSETKFLMQAAIVENGKIRSMGSGSDYERMSGEPCPITCGEKPGYYLKMK